MTRLRVPQLIRATDTRPFHALTGEDFRVMIREELAAALAPTETVYLTRQAVADLLGVSPKTILRLIRDGLPAEKLGREWRFERAKVDAFMRKRKAA